jgi:hypothetical protein
MKRSFITHSFHLQHLDLAVVEDALTQQDLNLDGLAGKRRLFGPKMHVCQSTSISDLYYFHKTEDGREVKKYFSSNDGSHTPRTHRLSQLDFLSSTTLWLNVAPWLKASTIPHLGNG